jgi:hypothetical protein
MLIRRGEARVPTMREEVFPAPTKGWMQSGNLLSAPPDAAEVLDNFIVTTQGVRLRGGSELIADVGSAVKRFMVYNDGTSQIGFASTANAIYNVNRVAAEVNSTATFADVQGLTSGDFSYVQFGTAAGTFLVAVNGADAALYFDGTAGNPINAAAINNVPFDTQTLPFAVGQVVTGGTSGATATIVAIIRSSATAGTLKVGAITSGPFQNNETLTTSTGAALANGASSSASAITITGVATTALSQVNVHKRRLWFVEKNTLNAWYLPVDSIGGAATKFDFSAVFRNGGVLLFTATWSLDSGSGIDDVFLAVTDQGEIAVYEGTDPGTASTWSLSGVYEIGQPIDKHAFFKAGGDLAILTEDGIIPTSEALRKDRAALQASAITFPIEDAWKANVADLIGGGPVTATLWQAQTILLIGTPATTTGLPISFIANARTGAWSRITGWDVQCSAVFDDGLYFGTSDGLVLKADSGGNDNGAAYVARYVPKFSYSPVRRGAVTASITYRAQTELMFDLYAHADYKVDAMPTPIPTSVEGSSTWGTGVWGTFVWGGSLDSFNEWQAVRASGYALTPAIVISSNQVAAVDFEIVGMRLRSEQGYSL